MPQLEERTYFCRFGAAAASGLIAHETNPAGADAFSQQQTMECLMRYLLLALLAIVHLSVSAASDTPEAAAEAFYRWVLSQKYGGLPSPQQRNQLTRFLTEDFVRYLAATSKAERQCVAVTPPDMKPPIWEGNIFVGNYEGAVEAWYGEPHAEGREVIIGVDLLDVDDRLPKGHKNRAIAWHDSVKLRKEKQGWLVADLIRKDSGSLTAELRKYVNKEGRECGRQR